MYFGFENICVRFGSKNVLKDLTLALSPGEFTVLIGQNGCGKSTLLRTVFQTVKPSSGQVVLNGRPLTAYSAAERAKKIAYLPQSANDMPDMEVAALVACGRYPHTGIGHRLTERDREIVEDAMRVTGVAQLGCRKLATLSGGEYQRARLAMCVAQQPQILILDEPTTHLDIGYQLEVLDLIRRLNRERGMTVLAVLHDLNHAARYADRICAIRDGGLYAAGAPREVLTAPCLRALFGIRAEIGWDAEYDCPTVYAKPVAEEVHP